MRLKVLILLGILLISFVGADDSSGVQTDFTIMGCSFEDGVVGVAAGECSTGDAEGHFYCSEDRTKFITTEDKFGCSLGEESYTLGDDFCCPDGYRCNTTSLICERRIENCFVQTDPDYCKAIGCIWFNGICVESVRDFDCGIYDNKEACDDDVWNLGQIGIGTKFCGTTMECNDGTVYTISKDRCECEWYPLAPADIKKCQVKLTAINFFGADDKDEFWCSNAYKSGECIDGERNITWFSSSSVDMTEDCKEVLGCNGGEITRFCGESIIKLSGFSLFSIFFSSFIIGIYYFLHNSEGLNKEMY